MRGILLEGVNNVRTIRIIPACAGNTPCINNIRQFTTDHPRLCGEYLASGDRNEQVPGSSPLVRGILSGVLSLVGGLRIIPACAGNTDTRKELDKLFKDHPRLCGEYGFTKSPIVEKLGSSPLVRGIPIDKRNRNKLVRIIPACAGNTHQPFVRFVKLQDHPRLCGEYAQVRSIDQSAQGSSPLVRGIRKVNRRFECIMRIIPACAGNTWLSGKIVRL